ncbi:MAG: response regulator [Candidatus Hydrogenedentales bacterium]
MSQPSIFVIDDDASVRKALERLIRAAGMAAQTFAGAEEFLAAELPHPDCLVLDLRMPGMNGLELQQRLKSESCWIPIVFITAHDDQEACQAALAAGAIDVLLKPFEDHALLEAISKAIARSAPISESNHLPPQ